MRMIMLASALCLAATASQAGTFVPTAQSHATTYPIIRVAQGCGVAFHLNAYGVCRPNSERVVVIERPAVVARPVIVERPVVVERSVVVERPVVVRRPVVEEVVVRRPVPTCGVRVGPLAVRGVC